MYRLGIDVGGTFTDLTIADEETGEFSVFKALSTPQDPLIGILDGFKVVCEQLGCTESKFISACRQVVHGTTIGTNAVIERNGPVTGLLATKGFRDVSEFMSGGKHDTFNLHLDRPKPLVPRQRRLGVSGRIKRNGREAEPLDEDEVRLAARTLRETGVEAIAVAFLWSQVNPQHERRARAILAEELPDVPVVLSSDVLPQLREWDRTSATILSAYTLPAIARYFSGLRDYLRGNGLGTELLIIQCDGGCAPADRVLQRSAKSLGSGPAAAPAAAIHAVSEFLPPRATNLLSADMGGTSFDVCLIRDGHPTLTRSKEIDGMPMGFMAADIVSIGAGGGSIAWIDPGGALQVGPRSAGSSPGPACYRLGGTEPTVTDCFVALGYIDPNAFIGGRIKLDPESASEAIENNVAKPLKLSVAEAANAILRIASFKMVRAMATMSVERGVDPRTLVLTAGGGAGGVVIGRLAEEAGIDRVIVPRVAGGYSAFGMTVVDLVFDYTRTMPCDSDSVDVAAVNTVFAELEAEALADMRTAGVDPAGVVFQRFYDASYWGQAHEIVVPLEAGRFEGVAELRAPFDAEHDRIYTFQMPDDRVIFYHWRLNAVAPSTVSVDARPAASKPGGIAVESGKREVYFDRDATDTPVYRGPNLLPGHVIEGPAVIEEPTTSVTVYPGHAVRVGKLSYDYRVGGRTTLSN